MDPLSFPRLMHELRSVKAARIRTVVADLVPGQVIASSSYDRHVVVEFPRRLNRHTATLVVAVRHLHGGHTLRPWFTEPDAKVLVYAARLERPTPDDVPIVPDCVIPGRPAVGDRVVLQNHESLSLGYGHIHKYDGEMWLSENFSERGRRTINRYETASVRAFVRTWDTPLESGWWAYLPAAERHPHLHMDGHPVPARTVDHLHVGDVALIPGGGRLLIEHTNHNADGHTLILTVLAPSRHPLRHLTWLKVAGDRIEHRDSGRRGMVYATEPRADEIESTSALAA
jgi:hypothetical protein